MGYSTNIFKKVRSRIRESFPETIEEVFEWANELWSHEGVYSQAIQKSVRYFLSDVDITDIEGLDTEDQEVIDEEFKNYKKLLKKHFNLLTDVAEIGDDYIAWGNSFTSLHRPFKRMLVCPDCGSRFPYTNLAKENAVSWDFSKTSFSGKCPKCDKHVQWKRNDMKLSINLHKPTIIRWAPQCMRLNHNPITNETEYYLNINKYDDLVAKIKDGDEFILSTTPWQFIVLASQDNKLLKFDKGTLYHMRLNPPSYIAKDFHGWGVPKFMSEFEHAAMIVLLNRYNEAIVTDYLIPFRVFSPPATGGNSSNRGSSDPMMGVQSGDYLGAVKTMIERHRIDPTDYNFLPYPLQYQIIGGEGKDLIPIDIINAYIEKLLSSISIPQEFYGGSMNNSVSPYVGFKLFENSWRFFTDSLNGWFNWLLEKYGEMQKWDKVEGKFIPSSIDSTELVSAKLELMGAGKVSDDTALASLGIDASVEAKKIQKQIEDQEESIVNYEDKMAARQAGKAALDVPSTAENMALASQQNMPPGGGMGAGPLPPPTSGSPSGGSYSSSSIDELMLQAGQMAAQILQMPSGERKSQLLDLGKNNQALHAMVKQQLEQMENQAGQQGVMAARAGQM